MDGCNQKPIHFKQQSQRQIYFIFRTSVIRCSTKANALSIAGRAIRGKIPKQETAHILTCETTHLLSESEMKYICIYIYILISLCLCAHCAYRRDIVCNRQQHRSWSVHSEFYGIGKKRIERELWTVAILVRNSSYAFAPIFDI